MRMTTRFPEAILLRKITATVVAKNFVKYFTMTALPNEIQPDQGRNFMSKTFRQTMQLLEIPSGALKHISSGIAGSLGAIPPKYENYVKMLLCRT